MVSHLHPPPLGHLPRAPPLGTHRRADNRSGGCAPGPSSRDSMCRPIPRRTRARDPSRLRRFCRACGWAAGEAQAAAGAAGLGCDEEFVEERFEGGLLWKCGVRGCVGADGTRTWQWLDPVQSKSKRHVFWGLVRIYCRCVSNSQYMFISCSKLLQFWST